MRAGHRQGRREALRAVSEAPLAAAIALGVFAADTASWWLYRRKVERLLAALLEELRRRG